MATETETYVDADFYTGRGEDAVYLGTAVRLAADGVPAYLFQSVTDKEYGATDYARLVRSLVSTDTWPHEYDDSTETPWAYAYDTGSVYVYRYGVEMLVIRCNTHRTVRRPNGGPVLGGTDTVVRDWRPVNTFPTMKETRTA